ncbi:MAG: TnsA endonuclease C-terminal domain-containing protein, partial [Syntrophorhabdus sp.]
SDISLAMVKNIEWIHSSLELDDSLGIPPELILQVEHSLFEAVSSPVLSLSHAALSVDKKLGLKVGASLGLVKHLIAKRYWTVDMATFINPSKAIVVERSTLLKNYEGMSA